MMACVKCILFSAVYFLHVDMPCVKWECMQPKEQMLVCAVHDSLCITMNSESGVQ